MTWLFSLIWIPLAVCFALGAALSTAWWLWRRRAVNAEYEKRRLAAEAESDRLRLRVSSLKLAEARADDLQLELEKARTDTDRLPQLERELKELRLQMGLVTELENQIINLRTRADQADRLERQLADLEHQLASGGDRQSEFESESEPEGSGERAITVATEAVDRDASGGGEAAGAQAADGEASEARDADVDVDDDTDTVIELRPVIDLTGTDELHTDGDADEDLDEDPTPGANANADDAAVGADDAVIDLIQVSHADDLKVIKGIGPMLESKLNGMGITTWEQIAALSSAEIAAVGEVIAVFPGRIKRDSWVEQAAAFVDRFPLTEPYDRPTKETLKKYT